MKNSEKIIAELKSMDMFETALITIEETPRGHSENRLFAVRIPGGWRARLMWVDGDDTEELIDLGTISEFDLSTEDDLPM